MMRDLGLCPRCQEDELCLYRALDSLTIFCQECGWRTSQPIVAGVDIDIQIAEVVKLAQNEEKKESHIE